MTRIRRFPNDPTAVRSARRFALDALPPGCPPQVLEVLELLVSELAGNCVRHTASGFEVRVTVRGNRVRVCVADRDAGRPVVRKIDPMALDGRGLALIDMLASSWGVRRSRSVAGGKCVWFVLDMEDRSRTPSRSASAIEPESHTTVHSRGRRGHSTAAAARRGPRAACRRNLRATWCARRP